MPVTSITMDPETRTMTAVATYATPLRRLWDAYVDPRQVERFWTVVTHPSRFLRHDAFAGGRSLYRISGPEGFTHLAYWEWLDVKAPEGDTARIEMLDGSANEDGTPNTAVPGVRMVFDFEATAEGTRLTSTSYCDTEALFGMMVQMGIEGSTRASMDQIDALVSDVTSFGPGHPAQAEILSDTQVRVSRVVPGTVEQVWRAHREAELLTGEQLASVAPYRAVTTEAILGTDGLSTTNELTLTPLASGTLVSTVITYPTSDARDAVLATGMVDGLEASCARLEKLLAG